LNGYIPTEAPGLAQVFSATDVRADSCDIPWEGYAQIFDAFASWDGHFQLRLIPDDAVVEILEAQLDDWKSEVRAVAVNGYRVVFEHEPGVSDSNDEANKPDELKDMYGPGCSQGDAQLGSLDEFVLRKASQGDPRALAVVQGRAGGQGTVSRAQPGPAGIVPKDPRTEST
jgi:hypothetical protein